jgi:MATE family multidrug resistance protein
MSTPGIAQSSTSAASATGASFWAETRTTSLLALPIIVGQVLQNALGVIDTLMVGRVSVEAVAGASLATAIFMMPLIFGFGVMAPFSVFVSRAFARGESAEAVHHLRRGLAMGFMLSVGLALIISASSADLNLLHQPAAVVAQARPFLLLLAWSIVPMYLFQTLRQYCEALHTPSLPMLILCLGVLANITLNWIFIFGHLGFPALGLIGAGWATLLTRTIMFLSLATVVWQTHLRDPKLRRELRHGRFHGAAYKALLGLGLPAGFQVILEVGAFSFAAIMMGWISETALAAQQVALSVASTVFMIPLGLSMAAAIRVSHAIGSNDLARARACSRGSLLLTWIFMGLTAIITCTFTRGLAALFVRDTGVIFVASHVLFIAGLFQIFDGTQIVCVGILRGLNDVKYPTVLSLIGYWIIGLPISYLLAFTFRAGAVGVWIGLLIGLAVEAVLLILRLQRKLASEELLRPGDVRIGDTKSLSRQADQSPNVPTVP